MVQPWRRSSSVTDAQLGWLIAAGIPGTTMPGTTMPAYNLDLFDVDTERCPACGGRLRPVGAVARREEARHRAAGLSVLGARGPPGAA
jgi:hypothetical protein